MNTEPSLFAPDPYAVADPAAIVREYPFGLLVTGASDGIHATSIPMYFETDDTCDALVGHMARRNSHASSLRSGQTALAVFLGPHAYISSTWYRAKPEVPTWNFVAAHVRGTLHPIDDAESQLEVLRRTVAVMERESEKPWTLEQAPKGRVESLLPLIRSFRLTIQRIEGVKRLSQKHPPSDRLQVIRHLLSRGDGNSAEIARMMAELGTC